MAELSDDFQRAIIYRTVYGAVRDRLERYYSDVTPEVIRRDPLHGTRINPESLHDPETRQAVVEAVDDAIAGRRPKVVRPHRRRSFPSPSRGFEVSE
jgi:hypothetical protein